MLIVVHKCARVIASLKWSALYLFNRFIYNALPKRQKKNAPQKKKAFFHNNKHLFAIRTSLAG